MLVDSVFTAGRSSLLLLHVMLTGHDLRERVSTEKGLWADIAKPSRLVLLLLLLLIPPLLLRGSERKTAPEARWACDDDSLTKKRYVKALAIKKLQLKIAE